MAPKRPVEIVPRRDALSGSTRFSDPLPSDETLIAEVQPGLSEALFCHRFQTDQLMVLQGALDLVVLQDRRLRRISLRQGDATWVRIPPGVPHGAINRGQEPVVVVNAVLRHGPSHATDYRPRPIPSTLLAAWRQLQAEAPS